MGDLEQEIYNIVKPVPVGSIIHADSAARRLIRLINMHGWKAIMRYIKNFATDKIVSIHIIYPILCRLFALSRETRIPIDIAFEFNLHCSNINMNTDLFRRVFVYIINSENVHVQYFLSKLVYDDKAKPHIAKYNCALIELIIKSANECTLYELKIFKDWLPQVKECSHSHIHNITKALKELTRCIEQFAGMKRCAFYSDVMIITQ
jgi:hypothetical protein